MARELSQAELLDFLCQAGGRVANAALLGHFKGFLRDPAAGPEELRRRREQFKGFVNSVATVKQEAPGAAKAVVLRKRFRELVGEEPKPGPAPQAPLDVAGSRAQQQQGQGRAEGAPRAQGGRRGECLGKRAEEEEEEGERPRSRTCGGPPRAELGLGGRAEPRLPASPAPKIPPAPCALLGGQKNGPSSPAEDLPALGGGAPQANGPPFPVGAPPSGGGGLQQRILEWVARAHQVSLRPDAAYTFEEGPWPGPPSSARGSACPSPSLDSRLGPPDAWREERPPVFRSIRCQLALQDLDEFLEQESPAASEDSGSASGGSSSSSDSYRGEGEPGFPRCPSPGGHNGCLGNPTWVTWSRGEGLPSSKPRANGPAGPSSTRASGPPQGAPIPGHLIQITRGSSSEDEPLEKDSKRLNGRLPKAKKVARLPSPTLDAPLSPQLAPRQGSLNSSTSPVEGLGLDTDTSPEHRSSLVPLEPREHAWLVKVATGSWLQARALFLEDPHLATRKDFISGYTVLHWLAKHGNAQVLLDFVTGARKAGVALDVNVKSGCGYTPLHLAAMHGHQLVIRVLVQKLHGQVQVRDSSGKRPWQYLSSSTSGEIWQLLGAPRGKTIFPAHPIARSTFPTRRGKSPDLARKISRKTSLAAYLKPQHIKWKMANKYPALQEREEYSD